MFHVIAIGKLHHTISIFIHIREDNISSLAHEVLQVLPAASAG
jgi:hypothetical protein